MRRGVAWIRLARPATGNRLDAELQTALADACATASARDDVSVIVLAAQGAMFCSGLPVGLAWTPAEWPDAVGAVAGLTKPVIAVIGGEARGWGVALALACDLRIASRAARFVLPETHSGLLPGGGVTQRLTRMVGPARALELLLVRPRLTAAEAVSWGVVQAVVSPTSLDAAATRLAKRVAARGPIALRFAKEAVTRALDLPLDDGMRLEHDLYALLQTTSDRREGIGAFLARRAPRFHAR